MERLQGAGESEPVQTTFGDSETTEAKTASPHGPEYGRLPASEQQCEENISKEVSFPDDNRLKAREDGGG